MAQIPNWSTNNYLRRRLTPQAFHAHSKSEPQFAAFRLFKALKFEATNLGPCASWAASCRPGDPNTQSWLALHKKQNSTSGQQLSSIFLQGDQLKKCQRAIYGAFKTHNFTSMTARYCNRILMVVLWRGNNNLVDCIRCLSGLIRPSLPYCQQSINANAH